MKNKHKKTQRVLKKQYVVLAFFSLLSLPLSRASYYSILIYKALNVILHVQVKGRE